MVRGDRSESFDLLSNIVVFLACDCNREDTDSRWAATAAETLSQLRLCSLVTKVGDLNWIAVIRCSVLRR